VESGIGAILVGHGILRKREGGKEKSSPGPRARKKKEERKHGDSGAFHAVQQKKGKGKVRKKKEGEAVSAVPLPVVTAEKEKRERQKGGPGQKFAKKKKGSQRLYSYPPKNLKGGEKKGGRKDVSAQTSPSSFVQREGRR